MVKKEVYSAIGLMSGTSLDGVDAALIKTDGKEYVESLDYLELPYDKDTRFLIRQAFGKTDFELAEVQAAEAEVTKWHIRAVRELMAKTDEFPRLIGFHGQTTYHEPAKKVTIQLGDAQELADACGVDTIADFRSADVEADGQGAPLAPLYHFALARASKLETPCVVLNIGGVANVTYIGESEEDLLAFDCGPGNALMDDWAMQKTEKPCDYNGALAQQGKVDGHRVKTWLEHEYFSRIPPKSLDRDEWDIAGLGKITQDLNDMSAEDGAATLLAFTVAGILKSLDLMPETPKAFYVCGGGRKNRTLMAILRAALEAKGIGLENVDELGWNGDALEAQCFAYLAVRSKRGLSTSLPKTTGVANPMTGGVMFKAH